MAARIRERWLATGDAETAATTGTQHSGRIITCAAMLLCAVFAGFLVAGFVPVKAIGLGLVLAVALDATIVRMLLVPRHHDPVRVVQLVGPRPLRRLHARLGIQETPAAPAARLR